MLFAARHHEECNCCFRKGRHGEEIGPRTTGKEGRIGKRRKRRSEEACRATGRWGQVRRERRKGDPSQREEDPRKHPDAAVQLSSQNMQCRSWGLLVCLFLLASSGGDLFHRISARTSGAQNFFLSHVTFGIARSSCLSKALQPKGTIP